MKIKSISNFMLKGTFYEKDKMYIVKDEIGQEMISNGMAIIMSRIAFICPKCLCPNKEVIEQIDTMEKQIYTITDRNSLFFNKDFLSENIINRTYLFPVCNHKINEQINLSDYLVITDEDKKVFIKLGIKNLQNEKKLNEIFFKFGGVKDEKFSEHKKIKERSKKRK